MIHSKTMKLVLREKPAPAFWRRAAASAILSLFVATAPSRAQEMLRGVDLAQPAYSQAELTREAIEAALKARKSDAPLDLSDRSLNGLDLSGLDLSNANLHAARLVKTRLVGAKLDHAILDQAWLLEADVSRASLVNAHLFSAQMQRMRADDADFSHARVTGDLTGASLRRAKFVEADLSSDMKNQSMGLMRVVLGTANVEDADFTAANLSYADLRFLRAARANFSGAALEDADASGADFTGAKWDGVRAMDLDLDQARIDESAKPALKDAKNLDRARTR
ncbi:MAG TPA: pentapeptide repeat-containing protein [Methylocystis sp.]|nr:pentapeptide repeat-containing protein [Methylocystis sp.]